MLVLHPPVVRFNTFVWEDASSVAIDRQAARVAESYSDAGPHTAFVDVPERRTVARVTRRLDGADLDAPALGEAGELVFYAGGDRDGSARTRLTLLCVLTGVETIAPAPDAPRTRPAVQTLTFLGVHPAGADPLTMTAARIND